PTAFPYTTLFRSEADEGILGERLLTSGREPVHIHQQVDVDVTQTGDRGHRSGRYPAAIPFLSCWFRSTRPRAPRRPRLWPPSASTTSVSPSRSGDCPGRSTWTPERRSSSASAARRRASLSRWRPT